MPARYWWQLPERLEVRDSQVPHAGKGLYARDVIPKESRIGRYRGTLYSKADWRRVKKLLPKWRTAYAMQGRKKTVVDGYMMDNHMRWINHSITPNAQAVLFDDARIFIHALRDIQPQEEIFIDYGYDPTLESANDD